MGIFKTNDTEFEMYDPSDGDTIFTVDRASLDIDLSDNTLSNLGDVSIEGDLQIATGQSIEDGSGSKRLEIRGGVTDLNDENERVAVRADRTNGNKVFAYSDAAFSVSDKEGDFDALTYATSSSAPGTLELTNANLKFPETASSNIQFPHAPKLPNNSAIEVGDDGSFSGMVINLDKNNNVPSNNTYFELRDSGTEFLLARPDIFDLSLQNTYLRLATGQSIEDGSGTERFKINSSTNTDVNDGNGDIGLRVSTANGGYLSKPPALGGSTVTRVIDDNVGDFQAVEYVTSSSAPGTLQLTNAVLDANQPAEFADYRDLEPSSEPSTPSGDTLRLWVDQTDGNYKAKDSAGDTVTLITTE